MKTDDDDDDVCNDVDDSDVCYSGGDDDVLYNGDSDEVQNDGATVGVAAVGDSCRRMEDVTTRAAPAIRQYPLLSESLWLQNGDDLLLFFLCVRRQLFLCCSCLSSPTLAVRLSLSDPYQKAQRSTSPPLARTTMSLALLV